MINKRGKKLNAPADKSASSSKRRSEVDFDAILEAFSNECRAGKNPSIDDYIKRYPQHKADIESLFPSVQWMEQLKDAEQEERANISHAAAKTPSKTIEDYRIVREIGRGGMGIVYEAYQKTLQRRVALKLLHEKAIPSAKRVARFAREARSAAGLHHTNIVPVFGFGEYEKTHYYAMQYIDGVNIEQVVSALRKTISKNPNGNGSSATSSSSAMSHASALQKGTYNKPRRIESESQIGSAVKQQPSSDNTVVDKVHSMTVDEIGSNSAAFDFSSCDTFDLFQLTSETQNSDDEAADDIETEIQPNRSADLDFEKLSAPYWKSVARIGFQIADALHYAHSNRVIHRDIKPANLLLDSRGTVWVTDFGLAKAIEEDNLTKTGDTVGTLRYMSPEQVSGKVDLRSDIYSLGLTLYELATLHKAFEQQNQAQLFKSKTTGAIDGPRKLNPYVPRDLETIIIKATATNPEARYQTAGQFAADLQLFLEDRPIQSRRANMLERTWRWTRRNPVVASLTALAMALLLITAVVSTVSNIRTSKALAEAKEANEEAEKQKKLVKKKLTEVQTEKQKAMDNLKLAEKNLGIAVDAFGEVQRNLASRGQPESMDIEYQGSNNAIYTTQLTEEDAKLLSSLIGFYEQFIELNTANTNLHLRKAEAYHYVGNAYSRLREFDLADQSFQKAEKLYQDLIRQNPEDVSLIATLARIYNDHGEMYSSSSKVEMTLRVNNRAKTFLLKHLAKFPDSNELKFELGYTFDLLGSLIIRSGVSELALNQDSPKPKTPQRGPKFQMLNRNDFLQRVRQGLIKATKIFDELAKEEPWNAEYLSALARTQRHQLAFALMTNNAKKADEYFKAAVDTLKDLTTSYKDNPKYIYELADTLSMASTQLPSIASPEQALKHVDEALTYCEQLTEKFPKVGAYQLLKANCYRKLALIQAFAGKENQAASNFDKTLTLLQELIKEYPDIPSYRIHVTLAKKQFADATLQIGRKEDSVRKIRSAKNQLLKALTEFQQYDRQFQSIYYYRILSSLCSSLAKCHLELGEIDEAIFYERRAQFLSKTPLQRRSTIFERRFRGKSGRK